MTTRTIRTSMRPMTAVRQKLAEDQLEPAERRHVQLLERAELTLTHDRHRRQIRSHDQKQQREDSGQHEIAAFESWIEPDAHAGLDAAPGAATEPAAFLFALDQFLRVTGNQIRRISHRDIGRARVRAVGQHLQGWRDGPQQCFRRTWSVSTAPSTRPRARDDDRRRARSIRRQPARKCRTR